MMKVLYPGSFDPITKGHMNIINQSTELFDEIVVAVLRNPLKNNHFFTEEERVDLIKKIYINNDKVKVIASDEASSDLAIKLNCKAIVRGLRSITDFDYEIELAQINKDISDNQVNTICLFADPTLQNISSSAVKQVFYLNKNISKYVDETVEFAMKKKVLRR